MIYSITLFTKSISFECNEEIVTPTSWESVVIPNEIMNMTIKYMMPSNFDEYDQAEKELTKLKCKWLSELAEKGYTAVRMTAGSDSIKAETTKDPWKRN
jgi:hypothetical protein